MSFFRNLFRWRPGAGNASDTAILTAQAAPAPIPAAPTPPHPMPAAQAAPQAIAAIPAIAAVATQDCVAFPLKAITDLFPQELKPVLRKQPSEHVLVQIPRAVIQPQLASGAVRITFGELRAATPEIFFHPDGAPADTKVLLPLEIILRAMMPTKREDQRQPAIPVNIPSIFAKAGAPPARPAGTASRGAEPWYSQRRPTYEAPPEAAPPVATAPIAQAAAAAVAAAAVTPPAPVVASTPPIPAAAAMPPWPKVDPAPRSPSIPPAASTPARAAIPSTPVCAPAPPAVPPAVPRAMPAAPLDSIVIPLALVLPAMPSEIHRAFDRCDPTNVAFVIPMAEFESRMRTGKLLFKWSQLKTWCGAEGSASVPEEIEIELPLATVVPIFLAARGAAPDSRKKVEVDSRIPDVFGKSNVPAPAPAPAAGSAAAIAPVTPPVAAPVPVAVPAAPIAPAPPAPGATSHPLRLEKPAPPPPPAEPAAATPDPGAADPAQVVASLRALDGVSGAFLATSDGLLIAGDVPDSNDSVLAAFAPTVFSQMAKYAEMARMGLPEAVALHFKSGTVHVRKVGRLYIGVLMHHGSPLPDSELDLISTALQPQAS